MSESKNESLREQEEEWGREATNRGTSVHNKRNQLNIRRNMKQPQENNDTINIHTLSWY